ncbi:MAG: phage tail protein [Pseudodesulfovibrio sp.]|uniref:phage tail protein n=1 Tax=Pseudodesulfovibrio sp. TaxID=2035812 RepID=UPI003D0D7459
MHSTYTTMAGDTPDIIAKRVWDDETLMHLLVAANPALVGAVVLDAGMVLTVPELPDDATEIAPPWRTS